MPAKFISRIFFVLTLSLYFLNPPDGFSSPNPFLTDGTELTSLTLHLLPDQGLIIEKIGLSTQLEEIRLPSLTPLFSLLLSDQLITSSLARPFQNQQEQLTLSSLKLTPQTIKFKMAGGIIGTLSQKDSAFPGLALILKLENSSTGKTKLENLVPAGEGPNRVYITAGLPNKWPHYLSRTLLYRPGKKPLGVLLPDNAWHLGFVDLEIKPGIYLTGLARRGRSEKAEVRRWFATLEPGGWIEYHLYFDVHTAAYSSKSTTGAEHLVQLPPWLTGLKMMFQERYLYDLEKFDRTLYERKDLQWIRKAYLMLLQFAWDRTYYDFEKQEYSFYRNLTAWDKLVGGIDIYAIWPTWPRLGLDQRNQFDLYRDLPGGLKELRNQADYLHRLGKKFFLSYNPWDEGTRHEEHLKAMENILRELDADGLILDTWGESSWEFQDMADRVKPGIIMYSEGMAVPKDMPGIVTGRVHDALYLPPPLNLNKFINPESAIFRVIQLGEGRFRREASVAFFNGCGSEINTMRPARPATIEEDLRHLGRTLKILRENNSVFTSRDWIPLYPVYQDGLWANCWPSSNKIIFTVFSLKPEGYTGPLIPVREKQSWHYLSLWWHEEINPVKIEGQSYLPVEVDGFSQHYLDTRLEGNVECLAVFPEILEVERTGDRISVKLKRKLPDSYLVITAGNPSYDSYSIKLPAADTEFSLWEKFRGRGAKIVIQLYSTGGEIADERVIKLPAALPRLVETVKKTEPAEKAPEGMVEIPAGEFIFTTVGNPDDANPVIPYPEKATGMKLTMKKFFIDKYPVTNAQFAEFLKKSGYKPKDPTNFLKHWVKGKPPAGQENHPVVWVSLEDALAYARWAGKRLPTEAEWQYAAQGTDGRLYPWGNEFKPENCNNKSGQTTPVEAFPSGASPFGVMDLVGNVWQMTADVYDNGVYRYVIIKGGSYYSPESSIWYPRSGPLPVNRQQIHLLMSPSLDRCATVGFRCVKDAR
ncbi:MAG: SUMF1/EgtB/PvdO family nonheme iron enzyme [Candidatus Aminicenantes bacterium]|nr:SUMF1/EgtB/PvdO family nonheme iron enzyme [Candidatus Aminicenantes bacterium]